MTQHGSMRYQVDQELRSQMRFGTSKGDVKHAGRQLGLPLAERTPGLFMGSTTGTYRYWSERFADWAKANHRCKTLDQAKPFVSEFLEKGRGHYAASSLNTQRSSLRKLYKDHDLAKEFKMPIRHKGDSTRSRNPVAYDKHFNAENHKELVDFQRGTGLRRCGRHDQVGLTRVSPADVHKDVQGNVWVHTVEKGGKERYAKVVGVLKDHVWKTAQEALERHPDPFIPIFDRIPRAMDEHGFRAEYANLRYEEIAGQPYVAYHPDHEAMQQVSWDLGHNRPDVFRSNYAR